MCIDYENLRNDRKYSVCLSNFAIACRLTVTGGFLGLFEVPLCENQNFYYN